MLKLNPYLNFDGNCEEAMNFYKNALGVEFLGRGIMRMGDAPGGGNFPEEEKNKVMHAALQVGNDILMASDIFSDHGQGLIQGNNNYLSLSTDTKEEADKIFNALSVGGQITMAMSHQFFGYYGSLTDKFGINWMIMAEVK